MCSDDDNTATDESSYGHMGDADDLDDDEDVDDDEEEDVEDEGDSIGSYH